MCSSTMQAYADKQLSPERPKKNLIVLVYVFQVWAFLKRSYFQGLYRAEGGWKVDVSSQSRTIKTNIDVVLSMWW